MEEYADIYYVDARNASRDHRTTSSGGRLPWQPARPVMVAPPPSRVPTYAAPAPTYAAPAHVVYPQPVATMAPLGYPQQAGLGALFQRLSAGQLIEMIAQAFVAFQPLPAAPVATDSTRDDIENLVTYQSALASHAKRDEQLRTIGGIVAKLV